jgi:hypothetical protein
MQRAALRALLCLVVVAISGLASSAHAGPRKVQKQFELDYHQPVVKPASNRHHKQSAADGTQAALATEPATGPCSNPVACENQLPGTPPSQWQIVEPGDASIQGFATEQSINIGGTVHFKVLASVTYRIDIYRVGWYQGNGARKVTTISNIAPRTQPACRVDTSNTTGLIDCGNWAETASWTATGAVSGVYFARLARNDNGGASYMFFNVRNDAGGAPIVYQTSDTQRAAYNNYGGNSLYQCTVNCAPGNPHLYKAAYKVSFNRPNIAVTLGMQYSFFGAEFEMVEFLEANGYDINYISGVDTERLAAPLTGHKVFISSGHDEYWSAAQRAKVEAARDAGTPVNLAFFSGNEIFWKTRYENSMDGTNTPYRTLVTYKETHFDAVVDPADPPVWTGEWRDGRFSPPGDGGRPENALSGTAYMVDPPADFALRVPADDGKMRFWRNTPVNTQSAGQTITLAPNTLGYEWDSDLDNGVRPAGLIHLSTNTHTVQNLLIDFGNTYDTGVATHHMTLYRASSGALVFGAGTVQWSWGLEGSPDGTAPVDVDMQQATVNLFADMGVFPTTLISGLTMPTQSTDTTGPTSRITSPTQGTSVVADTIVNIIGTASDSGGVVGGVEVSSDGGSTWHPVNSGRGSWMYQWQPLQPGNYTLLARAADDSANLGAPSSPISVTVTPRTCPCSIWPSTSAPVNDTDADTRAVELGVKFYSDIGGVINGIRFFKSSTNTGTHVGSLWTANGQLLAQATFSGESASGWQQVNFSTPVAITAGTHYVASYHTNVGHYSADTYYFINGGFDNPPLHALKNGIDGSNGVYAYGTSSMFPTNSFQSSNYWVDAVFTPNGGGVGGDTTAPTLTSRSPASGVTGVSVGTTVSATFSESVSNITFILKSGSTTVPSTFSYNNGNLTAVLTPSTQLSPSTTYTATVSGAKDAAGNVMTSMSWSFTTGSATQTNNCPCTIWSASTTPAVAANTDNRAVEVGVKFRADSNGFITGIRYYKSSPNTGTHIGRVWAAHGTLLAQATFVSESTSGWQQVNFNTPVSITGGTTYVASYHTNTGHYAGDTGFFTSAGVDNAPLHALRDGVSGGNGVYAYGASSTFPANSFQASNYWVDVVFSPTATTGCPCTIWPANTVPGTVDDTDPRAVEVGVKFRSDIAGRITGLRFYKASGNTGQHVASLWSSSGTLLARANFTGESSSGWQQVNFPTPVSISANTTYVASYHTDVGHYSADTGFFANSGVDNPPLHALRNGVSGSNGVYVYSSTAAFPTATFQSSNYWVDVVFTSP